MIPMIAKPDPLRVTALANCHVGPVIDVIRRGFSKLRRMGIDWPQNVISIKKKKGMLVADEEYLLIMKLLCGYRLIVEERMGGRI